MAMGDRRTTRRVSNLAITAAAIVAAVAFAALATQSDLGTWSDADAGIALNIGPAGLVPTASRQNADRKATDQFATFYERWTSTATSRP